MMASERDLIAAEHSEKLRELYFLVSGALQPLLDFTYSSASTTATNFFDKNDISVNKPFLLASIPKVRDQDTLIREIACNFQKFMYQTEEKNINGKRPREAVYSSSAKSQKYVSNSTPSGIPRSSRLDRMPQMSQNLRSQIECIENETELVLRKRISDLDVVTVPESYPTSVHNSTSLAELHYLTQLFPLMKLLPGSHKALMTENFELALLEGKISVLYSRIEELKRQKKWSLRQPQRYDDPFLYSKRDKKTSYTWDNVLQEGSWMATDFKESLKFKKFCCAQLAQAVRDYWFHGKVVCIKTRPIEHLSFKRVGNEEVQEIANAIEEEDIVLDQQEQDDILLDQQGDAGILSNQQEDADILSDQQDEGLLSIDTDTSVKDHILESIPLEPTESSEGHDLAEFVEAVEEIVIEPSETLLDEMVHKSSTATLQPTHNLAIDPSKLHLDADENTFNIEELVATPEPPKLPISESPFKSHVNINDLKKIDQSIIRNLPKFTPFDENSISLMLPNLRSNEPSIAPTSGLLHPPEPDDNWYKVVLRDSASTSLGAEENGPPPYQKGLFGVQSHRKFNFLKPPKPPLVKNIQFRSPTMWLPRDDQFLIHYVAEYCFNWDLIAASLLSNSSTLRHYTSNIEKRTPWQCFERYIQLNDKFQFRDMKGPNALPAQTWLEEAHKAQMTTKRRISPLGVGNESIQRGHRNLRWASMFDAMRKVMRRRELTAASKNAARKATPEHTSSTSNSGSNAYPGQQPPKRPNDHASTPQELSKMKHDRDKAIQEAYFQRQASRSRLKSGIMLRRADPLSSGSSPAPSGPDSSNGPSRATVEAQRRMQQQRTAQAAANADGTRVASGSLQNDGSNPTTTGGQLPHVAMAQHQANQLLSNMKAALPNSKAFTPEQIQKAIQTEKQRLLLQQQNSLPGNASAGQSTRVSSQMMQGRKGLESHPGSSPTMLGASVNQARSPTAKQVGTPLKSRILYPQSQFATIVNTIQQKNPNMSKEQAKKVAALYLANLQQQQQASRAAQGVAGTSNAQEALKARQAQLAAHKAMQPGKETDALGLKPEERGKMILTQDSYSARGSSLPYTRTTGSRASSPTGKNLQYPTNEK